MFQFITLIATSVYVAILFLSISNYCEIISGDSMLLIIAPSLVAISLNISVSVKPYSRLLGSLNMIMEGILMIFTSRYLSVFYPDEFIDSKFPLALILTGITMIITPAYFLTRRAYKNMKGWYY